MIVTVASTDEAAARLAARLKGELVSRELTPSDLARLIGRSQPTVWRWVNGEALPDHKSIARIQEVWGLRRGTVFRWAGLVDDDGLVDFEGIDPEARRSIRAILRDYGEDVPPDRDD